MILTGPITNRSRKNMQIFLTLHIVHPLLVQKSSCFKEAGLMFQVPGGIQWGSHNFPKRFSIPAATILQGIRNLPFLRAPVQQSTTKGCNLGLYAPDIEDAKCHHSHDVALEKQPPHFLPIHRNPFYLLSRIASSTWVVFSKAELPKENWLMADRNFSSNLVLSVFPAPLSPLLIDSKSRNSLWQEWFWSFHPSFSTRSGTKWEACGLITSLTWSECIGCHDASRGSCSTHWLWQKCVGAAPPGNAVGTSQWRMHRTAQQWVCRDSQKPR